MCFTFTPRLLDAYRLRLKRRIPALCATYSHMSDVKKFFAKMLDWEVLHRHTMGIDQWGKRETLTTPQPKGVSRGSVLMLFQFIKQIFIGIYSNIDHSPLFKTLHRSNSKINNKN